MRLPMGPFLATGAVLAAAAFPQDATANPHDISLRGIGRPQQQNMNDPAVRRYRDLSSELILSLAPRPMQPAETLGLSGFEFSVASTTTDINESADYWKGEPGSPVFEGVMTGRKTPGVLWTPSVHFRKGLPLSTEIGVHGTYLAYSEMFDLGAEFKVSIYESYFRWVPAVSGRVAFSRVFGAADLDIVTGEADGLLSLPIGIGGMLQVTPFAGGGMLFGHVNSTVLDETPYSVTDPSDQKGGADGSLYTFPTIEWQDNRFVRIFGGVRFIVAMLELMYELDVGMIQSNNRTLLSHTFKIGFDT